MDIKKTIDNSYTIWFGMNSIYEEWAKSHGLSGNSLMILYCVNNSKEHITPKMIIDRLHLPKQTVTSVLNSMQKEGLLYRVVNESNKREKLIVLTESGEKLTKKVLDALYEYEIRAYSKLTEKERELFCTVNEKLLRSFNAKDSN